MSSKMSKYTLYFIFLQCFLRASTCFTTAWTHASFTGTQSLMSRLVTKLQKYQIIQVRMRMWSLEKNKSVFALHESHLLLHTSYRLNLHRGINRAALSTDLSMVVCNGISLNGCVSDLQAAVYGYLRQCHCKTKKIGSDQREKTEM